MTAKTWRFISSVSGEEFLYAEFLVLGETSFVFPNIFKGLPLESLSEYKRFLARERTLTGANDEDRGWLNPPNVLRALEASIGHAKSPLYVMTSSDRAGVAMPCEISLGTGLFVAKTRKEDLKSASPRWSARVKDLSGVLAQKARKLSDNEFQICFEHLKQIRDYSKRPFVKSAAQSVLHAYSVKAAKKLKPGSAVRYASAMIRILEMISQKKSLILSKTEMQAFREIKRALEHFPPDFSIRVRVEKQKAKLAEQNAKFFRLTPPQELEQQLGYDSPGSWKHDLKLRTRRILAAIQMETGRRAKCLMLLTRGCFHISPISGLISLYIPVTKTKAGDKNYLPISSLWPEEELALLRDWLDETKDIPPKTSLLTIAGLRDRDVSYLPISQQAKVIDWKRERDGLARSLYLPENGGRIRLSAARTQWATWFLVRTMCAFNRELLDHPLMIEARKHRWFSQQNLDKLRAFLGSPLRDSVEVARRVMGHSNWNEFINKYCFAWPLLVALACAKPTND